MQKTLCKPFKEGTVQKRELALLQHPQSFQDLHLQLLRRIDQGEDIAVLHPEPRDSEESMTQVSNGYGMPLGNKIRPAIRITSLLLD